ncbi:MAG: hypothetical protein Terrestrivirus1_209 [Terrestrivirus sp.]|uniref:ATP-grasp domain-containing protein n=1 Tax=Terrestrivirus sp. TaxID=2487775 RepID=A0A3G4ZKG7_9VIRU|nr:MAG: hypothetical protein Terrestrivirus1_209 [Terrestrivirus sp.]
MIVVFLYNDYTFSYIYFYLKRCKETYVVLNNFNKEYFDKADAIVPFGINSQKKLYEIKQTYPEYKYKFLVNSAEVYTLFDDKKQFYDFVERENVLEGSQMKLIKTYDEKYDGPHKTGSFLVKNKRGVGSLHNKIITGDIYDIINRYNTDNQIQDILDVKEIQAVNLVCKKGKIISGLNFVFPGAINPQILNSTAKQYLRHLEEKYMKVLSKLVKLVSYDGFVEFELLLDANDDLYLLECNPRIPGDIKSTFENTPNSPYITDLINVYINVLSKRPLRLEKFWNNSVIIYNGNNPYPSHVIYDNVIIYRENILIPYEENFISYITKLSMIKRKNITYNDKDYTVSYEDIMDPDTNLIQNDFVEINDVLTSCIDKNVNMIFVYACEHTEFLLKYYNEVKENGIKFLIPHRKVYECFNDKIKFYNFMEFKGLGKYIAQIYDSIKTPCILKHNKSDYGRNTFIINKLDDVPTNINLNSSNDLDDYIICEIVEGNKEYATHILAVNGKIVKELTIEHTFDDDIFVHGITKKPLTSLTVEIHGTSLNVFEKIIKMTNYSGMLCIDYKIKDDVPKIFEINPRAGGSLFRTNNIQQFIDKYIDVCSRSN